jgi:hypothetical protein
MAPAKKKAPATKRAATKKAAPKEKAKASPVAEQDAMEIDNEGKSTSVESSEAAANRSHPNVDRDADVIRSDEESAKSTSYSDEEGSTDSDDSDMPTSFHQLRYALNNGAEHFIFACAGQIPSRQDDQDLAHCDSVTLRWDPKDDQVSSGLCRLSFSLDANAEESIG